MSTIPSELKYTATHEWIEREEEDLIIIGITDYAQHALGDIVFVELPEVGTKLDAGKECGVIESVKAASDLYSPLTGEVVVINEAVVSHPELINQSPYHDGWLIKIAPENMDEWIELMDADEYTESIEK